MEVAAQVADEQDSEKLTVLIHELSHLLAGKRERLNHIPHVATSPITVACPRCHAEAGDVCEVLLREGLEIVHVERIQIALAIDAAK